MNCVSPLNKKFGDTTLSHSSATNTSSVVSSSHTSPDGARRPYNYLPVDNQVSIMKRQRQHHSDTPRNSPTSNCTTPSSSDQQSNASSSPFHPLQLDQSSRNPSKDKEQSSNVERSAQASNTTKQEKITSRKKS